MPNRRQGYAVELRCTLPCEAVFRLNKGGSDNYSFRKIQENCPGFVRTGIFKRHVQMGLKIKTNCKHVLQVSWAGCHCWEGWVLRASRLPAIPVNSEQACKSGWHGNILPVPRDLILFHPLQFHFKEKSLNFFKASSNFIFQFKKIVTTTAHFKTSFKKHCNR